MGWFWNGECTSKARLDGKIAIVTGGNTGIGKYTVFDLFKRGAHVILACRNLEKGRETIEWIKEETKDNKEVGEVTLMELNLCSFANVRNFVKNFQDKFSALHLLINNAGVMAVPWELSEDGYEMHMATNHLGHFLLTLLLLPLIVSSAPARIVNVSSKMHIFVRSMHFDDFNLERWYHPFLGYARSKAANILFSKHLAEILTGKKVNVYSLHPGIVSSELSRNLDNYFFSGVTKMYNYFCAWFMKSTESGAQTTIYCAVDEATSEQSGLYYDDCEVIKPTKFVRKKSVAEELWNKSIQCVHLENEIDFLLGKK